MPKRLLKPSAVKLLPKFFFKNFDTPNKSNKEPIILPYKNLKIE